jgi:hypothetical protein
LAPEKRDAIGRKHRDVVEAMNLQAEKYNIIPTFEASTKAKVFPNVMPKKCLVKAIS